MTIGLKVVGHLPYLPYRLRRPCKVWGYLCSQLVNTKAKQQWTQGIFWPKDPRDLLMQLLTSIPILTLLSQNAQLFQIYWLCRFTKQLKGYIGTQSPRSYHYSMKRISTCMYVSDEFVGLCLMLFVKANGVLLGGSSHFDTSISYWRNVHVSIVAYNVK